MTASRIKILVHGQILDTSNSSSQTDVERGIGLQIAPTMRHQHQTRITHAAKLFWQADMLDVMQEASKLLRNSNVNVMISDMLGQRRTTRALRS
jgi:hypothetical protein